MQKSYSPDQPRRPLERKARRLLSVVTPAFNESDNLPLMYKRLGDVLNNLDLDWEWVVIDDHSTDRTFQVLCELAERDPRVRGVRLARNCGSHVATVCGLHYANGDGVYVTPADLQDPPETLIRMIEMWSRGSQVVWAMRAARKGEKRRNLVFSRIYNLIMRRVVGMKDLPATGADSVLMDRCVVNALRQFKEGNASLVALITWIGFKQDYVLYEKQARIHGRSGWTLEKKLKLAIDSITSFTYLPIRLMAYAGFVVAMLGFLYAILVARNAFVGHPVQGWSSLMVAVLVIGGIQMLMMGVLGEYLWRALDEARGRPRYLIEATTEDAAESP